MNATTTNASRHTTPFYLAEVIDAAGSRDPSFARGRHVYVRRRGACIDVRGAGDVFCRLSIAQASQRLRTVRDDSGNKTIVRGQARLDEACEAWHEAAREWRHRRPAAA